MKRIVILTADELRHDYFKLKFSLDDNIQVLKTYCDKTRKKYPSGDVDYYDLDQIHFSSRHQTEKDFFEDCGDDTSESLLDSFSIFKSS